MENSNHELMMVLSEIKGEVMVNRSIIQDVRDHQQELKPRVYNNDKRVSSLEQSRKTALTLIGSLWAVCGGGLLTWWLK